MSTARSLELPAPVVAIDAIVAGLHLPWDGVYQRPQHLLSRISRTVPVLIVEEPRPDGPPSARWIRDGTVTVYQPERALFGSGSIAASTIAAVTARIGSAAALVWLYTPLMLPLADAFPAAPLVFDAMDELSQFAQADPRIAELEASVLKRAAAVFCGGPSLYRSRAGRAPNVKLYSSGVDVDFFERARHLQPHAALAGFAKPVLGYIGVIDERIDLQLVAAIADARPDATLVMIGPTTKIQLSDLPRRPNIVYLGKQAYADLPALLAGIDVALMPFALNDSTRNISPTKTLEYLAAGKPVVSTAVPDVVSEYSGIVAIAGDRPAFIAALATAAHQAHSVQVAADERTRAATWDAIAASMLGDLEAAGIRPRTTV